MEQETKLQLLDKLRKENPDIVKKIMSVEDFSNHTTEREALRAARSKGMLKFLYTAADGKRQQKTTRLQTETEIAHLEAMIKRAKGPQSDGQASEPLGGELPLMEATIRPNALKKIILEEINFVISDVLKKNKNA